MPKRLALPPSFELRHFLRMRSAGAASVPAAAAPAPAPAPTAAAAETLASGLALIAAAIVLAAGCASPGARPALLSTSAGGRIEALWEASGGRAAWEAQQGVTFRYTVEWAEGAFTVPRILLWRSQPGKVWVGGLDPPSPGGDEEEWEELSLALPPGKLLAGEGSRRPDEVPAADPMVLDFALRSIALLFHLPLALGDGGWELRTLLVPRGVELAGSEPLEAQSRYAIGSLGPFLLPPAAETTGSPLTRLTYASSHPAFPRGVYEVRFGAYRSIDGILVAGEREHLRRSPPEEAVRPDPLGFLPPAAAIDRPVVLRERIEDIRFLGGPDASASLRRQGP
jgi:hypothetical protein